MSAIATKKGHQFEDHESDALARLVYRRFGENLAEAAAAWRRLLNNNCSDRGFRNLLRLDDESPRFSVYGRPSEGIDGEELVDSEDCVARVEQSGSEGYYLEVVRWTEEDRWHRYAFHKFFELDEAKHWERAINANSEMLPVFHALVPESAKDPA